LDPTTSELLQSGFGWPKDRPKTKQIIMGQNCKLLGAESNNFIHQGSK